MFLCLALFGYVTPIQNGGRLHLWHRNLHISSTFDSRKIRTSKWFGMLVRIPNVFVLITFRHPAPSQNGGRINIWHRNLHISTTFKSVEINQSILECPQQFPVFLLLLLFRYLEPFQNGARLYIWPKNLSPPLVDLGKSFKVIENTHSNPQCMLIVSPNLACTTFRASEALSKWRSFKPLT